MVTLTDIIIALQSVIDPFQPVLFLSFCLMATFAVIKGIKEIFTL